MKNIATKIGVFIVILFLGACNATKRVPDEGLLLKKNTIYVDGKKLLSEDIQSLIHQQPNSNLLGYPLRLHIYNLAKPEPDSFYIKKLNNKLKDTSFAQKLFSKKQLIAFTNAKIGFNKWLMETGEAPVIIDTSLTNKSVNRLEAYYYSKGYFNNKANYTINKLKRKQRATIDYNITLNKPYILDSISKNIASADIDSIYRQHKKNSYLQKGKQFNLADFQAERNRLTGLFRNSGIYNFQESSIDFDVLMDTIPENNDRKLPITVNIANATQRVNNNVQELEYKVHTINNVNLFIDATSNNYTDSLKYNNYTLYFKEKLRYKPKAITNAVFLNKDSIYRDLNYSQTLRQLSNLQVFKYPTIQRNANKENATLNMDVFLTSKPKFSLGLNTDVTHSNIQDFGLSFSTSLISRNIFRGAETLELGVRGSLGSSREARGGDSRFFNVNEIGADVKLNFPRIWFPFNTQSIIPKQMSPNTKASLGTSIQENIGLDKQTFNSILQYNWSPSNYVKNILELVNVQFVRNVNPSRFFEVYQNTYERLDDVADAVQNNPDQADLFVEDTNNALDPLRLSIPFGTDNFISRVQNGEITLQSDDIIEVNRVEERRERLTENNLIFASNFSYIKNNRQGFNDNSFSQFRAKVEFAGNLLSTLSGIINFDKDEDGNNLIFGVQYSQYAKTEFDYIKHWQIAQKNTLALRAFFGIAIPYGNSNSIPFSRSYFAGGSNDNRAWEAYSLGPGSTEAVNDFNEANLKLALNVEYRFDIFGDLKGALFADAGNIWNVFDNVDDEKATFSGLSSLQDIALGTGLGLRYDFGFFVFRFDTGFKTYNPARELNKRWFREYNFANAVFNIGINYPF